MSYFDGNLMDMTPYWTPSPNQNMGTILAMLNQSDNGQSSITEIFSQTNLSRDHTNNQAEERPNLGARIAARTALNIPTLERENIFSFAALFGNSIVPSPIVAVSPGFSPSTLFQTPNMFSNSLHTMRPTSPITNYKPQEAVERFNNETMMISNTELPHQPLQFNMSPQESNNDVDCVSSLFLSSLYSFSINYFHVYVYIKSIDIATDESVYIPSHESHVEPLGAPLIDSFESQDVDEANRNITSIDEENEDEYEEEGKEDDKDKKYEFTTLEDSDIFKPSSPKRRKFEVSSNMIGATRKSKVPRVIIHMESEEKNPDDGYRWRKYGQKVVKGNPNPRSYYKCTFDECNVKKHVEKGAGDVNLMEITYDGIHEHATPVGSCSNNSISKTLPGSSMSPGHHSGRTTRFERQPSSSYTTSQKMRPPSSSYTTTSHKMKHFTTLDPPIDMTHLYLTGLSKLPSLPAKQNLGFTYQNKEPEIYATPNGTRVYIGIMNRLLLEFGVRS